MTELELLRAHKRVKKVEKVSEGHYKILYELPGVLHNGRDRYERTDGAHVEIDLDIPTIRRRYNRLGLDVYGRQDAMSFALNEHYILNSCLTGLIKVPKEYKKLLIKGSYMYLNPHVYILDEVVNWCVYDASLIKPALKGDAYSTFLALDQTFSLSSYDPNRYKVYKKVRLDAGKIIDFEERKKMVAERRKAITAAFLTENGVMK